MPSGASYCTRYSHASVLACVLPELYASKDRQRSFLPATQRRRRASLRENAAIKNALAGPPDREVPAMPTIPQITFPSREKNFRMRRRLPAAASRADIRAEGATKSVAARKRCVAPAHVHDAGKHHQFSVVRIGMSDRGWAVPQWPWQIAVVDFHQNLGNSCCASRSAKFRIFDLASFGSSCVSMTSKRRHFGRSFSVQTARL